ncbi:hypothetical protein SAMD00019534_023750, partial [Acytostelium subglobosum LB1]|uniref:hypothetical protein n=1 Tax=Acytostelium subglobosum LB1 TaxID=1410327 RepID=UPI000644E2E8
QQTEQKDLISSLLEKDKNINIFYLKVISVIGFVCGSLKFLVAILPFNVLPFENEAHNILRMYFSGLGMFWLEWMSASSFIAGGIAMYPNIVKGFIKRWIMLVSTITTFIGSFVLFFITGSLMTSLWTLGVNSIFLVLCIYVNTITSNTQSDIASLNKYTYSHKKV